MDSALVYVGDPMCSWCWGFAPELRELERRHGLTVEVVVGGLRPGPSAEPLEDRLRTFLRGEWARIAEVTGQPFDPGTLDRDGWVYDTEPAARAVVTMRSMLPDRVLDFFERLQRAFYAEAIDVTDVGAIVSLAEEFEVDDGLFVATLRSEASRAAAWRDFAVARRLGASGFPTLFLRDGSRHHLVARGYRPADAISPLIAALGSGPSTGEVCEPGQVC